MQLYCVFYKVDLEEPGPDLKIQLETSPGCRTRRIDGRRVPCIIAEPIMLGEELDILLTCLWSCIYLMCLTQWPAQLIFSFLVPSYKEALILSKFVSTNSSLFCPPLLKSAIFPIYGSVCSSFLLWRVMS